MLAEETDRLAVAGIKVIKYSNYDNVIDKTVENVYLDETDTIVEMVLQKAYSTE